MRLPRLTRPMVLETPVRTPDAAGGHATIWTVKGSLFAEVMPGTGRQVSDEIAALSRLTCRIVLRASAVGEASRPVPGDRLREGAITYRIEAVAAYDRGAHYLTCYATEESVT